MNKDILALMIYIDFAMLDFCDNYQNDVENLFNNSEKERINENSTIYFDVSLQLFYNDKRNATT